MALEVDRRNLGEAEPAERAAAVEAVVATAAAGTSSAERVNPFTGTPACISALAVAEAEGTVVGTVVERALAHLRDLAPELTRAGGDPPDFLADQNVIETSSGERIVHLRQHVHGVPVFQAARLVRFDPEAALLEILGDHVPLWRDEIDLAPSLDAAGAVLAAARHLAAPDGVPGLRVSGRRPRLLAAFPLPASPSVLRKPPFPGLIAVHLVLFYCRPDIRLGWYVPLHLPDLTGQYDLIVAANGEDSGEILFCRDVAATAASADAMATLHNPQEEPLTLLAMPQPLSVFPPFRPADLPSGFPGSWVDRDRTEGNNVRCLRGGRVVRGASTAGRIVFRPASGTDDELAINAFFLCNFLHNFFYLLGFNEASGNFQRRNPSGVGRESDELEVRILDIVRGDASMLTEVDGHNALLNLGRIRFPGGTRHTALDADVVIHEFVHGVTARLAGRGGVWKPLLNGPPQAQALDEGTCDYFALTLQNHRRLGMGRPEHLVYGAWSSNNPVTGRRRHSYDGFAHPFSRLGQSGFTDPHDAGMIWCAALLAMNRGFGAVLGSPARGHELGWQLVVNALKQLPIGQDAPSFLDGREALLRALEAMRTAIPALAEGPLFPPERHGDLVAAVRQAFAGLGMGRNARSRGGTFAGLLDDFNP